MSNQELSPLATLRGECLNLAVRMLAISEAEQVDPRDAIRLAEEYVVWVLEAGQVGPPAGPGLEGALHGLQANSPGPSSRH